MFRAGVPSRIDGFTITGSDQAGGIVVNGYARFLEISNNLVASNQGPSAAGIRIGHPTLDNGGDATESSFNERVNIHNNHVAQNGGLVEPGAGIGLYTGSDAYRVTNNFVCGNFAQNDGAGVAHYGFSPGGLIADNQVIFNQAFDQTVAAGGNGGGILIAGHEQNPGAANPLSPGSGSVQVLRNRIQGNQAGSGDGGGIALRYINGQDVRPVIGGAATARSGWHSVDILNNVIVNNVAGYRGGAISLLDALNTSIINNTIANNDSTATAAGALTTTLNSSNPQPAGIIAGVHSNAALNGTPAGAFSNPVLTNNIILGNRSHTWATTSTTTNPPGQAGGILTPGAVWDFAVIGIVGNLNPTSSVLSDVPNNDPYRVASSNNRFANASIAAGGGAGGQRDVFVNPYFNAGPGAPGVVIRTGSDISIVSPTGTVTTSGTVVGGEFTTAIQSAAATDEGGNFIDVHYGPLTVANSDYHLANIGPCLPTSGGACLAIDGGSSPAPAKAALATDVDVQLRAGTYDIGADEFYIDPAGGQGNVPPAVASIPSQSVLVGAPFAFAVDATDANPQDQLTFSISTAPLGSATLPATLPSIDASTGFITWSALASPVFNGMNPGNQRDYAVTVTASDGVATSVPRTFTLSVIRSAGNPNAANDTYDVNRNGLFRTLAPGVLGNDTNPNQAVAPLRAILQSGLSPATSGTLNLSATGAFDFAPAANFVGTTSFTYRASNGANSNPASLATVTLRRELAVTSARHADGKWIISGIGRRLVGAGPRRLTISRDPNATDAASRRIVRQTVAVAADGSYSWSIEATSGAPVAGGGVVPGYAVGDTISIVADQGGGGAFTLTLVPTVNAVAGSEALTSVYVQCPGDTDGDAVIDQAVPGRQVVCKHLAAGDGYSRMADGTELYTFGFSDVTGTPATEAIGKGILNAQFPAPTLQFDEGDEVYLTLTNVGMLHRPDLFDPHSVHFHGFPNAAKRVRRRAREQHLDQHGIELHVLLQDRGAGHVHVSLPRRGSRTHADGHARQSVREAAPGWQCVHGQQQRQNVFAVRLQRRDGSTGYDVEFPIQIGSFDSNFHIQHIKRAAAAVRGR